MNNGHLGQMVFIKCFLERKSPTWQKNIFAFMLNLKVYVLFGTKIFDLVKNDVHNGEIQPHQEVGDRYMCLDNQSLKNCMHFSYLIFAHF